MWRIIAQATQPGSSDPASQPQAPLFNMLFPLAAMGLIFWLIFFRPRAKEQKQFKAMLANLKKGDRVMTIGGILGTVVNLKDDEITLKVDESTNTKMTFTRSSIKNVINGTTGSGTTR